MAFKIINLLTNLLTYKSASCKTCCRVKRNAKQACAMVDSLLADSELFFPFSWSDAISDCMERPASSNTSITVSVGVRLGASQLSDAEGVRGTTAMKAREITNNCAIGRDRRAEWPWMVISEEKPLGHQYNKYTVSGKRVPLYFRPNRPNSRNS